MTLSSSIQRNIREIFIRTISALAVFLMVGLQLQAAEKQNLFNGRNLDGWSGNPELWSVQEGAIVGSTEGHKLKANTFLVWQGGEVSDFRLTFKAKLTGDNNSGVQYRSELIDPTTWRVVGYQADMHPKSNYTAMLYSEGTGRGILATRGSRAVLETDATQSKVEAKAFPSEPVDVSQWHDYTITARSNRLIHQLDGVTTVDVTDNHEKSLTRGILALQVHRGPPMTVYFKDVLLEKLDSIQPSND